MTGRASVIVRIARGSSRPRSGGALPDAVNTELPTYWTWVDWNVKRRNAIWIALDAAARQAGASAYGWTGLTDADRMTRAQKFQDVRVIAKTASILFIENSAASAKGRFRLHLDSSRYLTTLLGTRPVVALTTTHHAAGREFALTSDEAAERRLRMITGLAGGVGAAVTLNADPTLDRRAAEIAPPVMAWSTRTRQRWRAAHHLDWSAWYGPPPARIDTAAPRPLSSPMRPTEGWWPHSSAIIFPIRQ